MTIPRLQGPWSVCLPLPTFQGLLMLVLYKTPSAFSCAEQEEQGELNVLQVHLLHPGLEPVGAPSRFRQVMRAEPQDLWPRTQVGTQHS